MTTSTIEPFSGAPELRAEHDALMARVDQALGADETAAADEDAAVRSLAAALRQFVERAVATGARIEAPEERSACQALIDYWSAKLARVQAGRELPELAAYDEGANPELPEENCPFVGAQPYAAGGLFAGRRSETEAVLKLVAERPLVVVSGPPGSGKTSLVLAGVLPQLRAQRTPAGAPCWRVLGVVRPGPNLLADLAREAAAATGADAAALAGALAVDAGALARALGDPSDAPAVVTVDQADGLLAAAAQPALRAAAEALAQAAAAGHRVLFVLREEFEERLLALPAFVPWRGPDPQGTPRCGRLSVLPMTPEQLREAIVAPSEAAGLHLHAEVVDDLVNRLAGQRAALSLLQHAMVTLWHAKRRNRVAWADYLKVRDALDAEKWRVEAEIQRGAAERERAAAQASELLAQHERTRFRRTLAAVAVMAVAMVALVWLSVSFKQEQRLVAKQRADAQDELRNNAPIFEQCLNIREALKGGSMLVDAEFVRRVDRQAAALSACSAASAPAARTPHAVASAVAARQAPAAMTPPPRREEAPAVVQVTPQPAAGAAPVASSAAKPLGPPPVATPEPGDRWPASLEKMSADEVLHRAQRLVYAIDQHRPARGAEELRRLYPLSWYWAQARWKALNLRSPLALAVLFDTAASHGPLQAATIRARADPSDGSLPAEKQLVESILSRREALRDTALSPENEPNRTSELREKIKASDWTLDSQAGWGG